jgi:Copper binding periplasmic protein CusF
MMPKSRRSRRDLLFLAAAAALISVPGLAQSLQHDRGTILNMDWNTSQVEIEDAKDRKRIWRVAKDATVKFSDQAWGNRGSTLRDLKKGMYVHFTYSSGDPEIIQDFDVKDLGSVNKRPGPAPEPTPAPGMTSGRVTAVDLNVAQVEVMVDGAGRKTYQAANARVLAGVKAGDRIAFRTEKQATGQEILVEVMPRR